jgi:hypothetical protein
LTITKTVFEEIKKIQPLYLYLVQDGYREQYPNEKDECLIVRNAILEMIDWECNLKTLFREKNLGPGKGTADAIKWFFNQEEAGIVLEHDCLPNPDFFRYCEILLDKYKDVDKVKIICGSNYQAGKKFNNASYYFGASSQLWGWASWRRSFLKYTPDIEKINYSHFLHAVKLTFKTKREQEYWINTYHKIKDGIVDTCDYQLMYLIWHEKGLIIKPNVNLISNIGFGEQAVHCKDVNSMLSNADTYRILPLQHPKNIKRSYKSDKNYHDNYLKIRQSIFIQTKNKIKTHLYIIYKKIKNK